MNANELTELKNKSFNLYKGDCLKSLRKIPDDTYDALVTDPPAGIDFLHATWDQCDDCTKWVKWLAKRLRECLRVMKPGAIGMIWSIPRTSDLTGLAIRQAGFEINDCINHAFGSGMPHSTDASKKVDWHYFMVWAKAEKWPHEMMLTCRRAWKRKCTPKKRFELMRALLKRLQAKAGIVRPVVSSYTAGGNAGTAAHEKGGTYGVCAPNSAPIELHRTKGSTADAQRWDGYGTGLKPAHEIWWVVQKPFRATVAANVLKHGVGALNIDACRVPRGYDERGEAWRRSGVSAQPEASKIAAPPGQGINLHPAGGWPANVVITHDAICTPDQCVADCPCTIIDQQSGQTTSTQARVRNEYTGHGNTYSEDRMLHVSPGSTYSDAGGASRYFNRFWWTLGDAVSLLYYAKASTAEREAGCDHLPKMKGFKCVKREEGSAGITPMAGAGRTSKGRANFHPTVKGDGLMEHLCRLACPEGGRILDPFGGSGSTAAAAIKQGFRCDVCEITPEYFPIIEARVLHAIRQRIRATRQLDLFQSPTVAQAKPQALPAAEQLQLRLAGAAQ